MNQLSSLEIFVCTYKARVTSLDIPHRRLIEIVQPHGAVKTINCNFGHKTQKGFEMYLKKEKKIFDTTRGGPALPNRRQRKREGDGSCFNSDIESVIIPKSSKDRTFAETAADSPYTVREVILHEEPLKVSAKFVVPMGDTTRKIRIVIFLRGNINILGYTSFDAAERIYTYIYAIIHHNSDMFVCLEPLPDFFEKGQWVQSPLPQPPPRLNMSK